MILKCILKKERIRVHTHKVRLAPDVTQLGEGGGLRNHYNHLRELIS